jgi:hypothetical protein
MHDEYRRVPRPAHRDDSQWLLKALYEAAGELEMQLWGLSKEELRWRPAEDEWCLKEIAGHLRDCEGRYLQRLRDVAELDEPEIPAFDADSIVPESDYRDLDLHEMLEAFVNLRHRTTALLWSLDPQAWQRRGIHPYLGPLTVTQIAREMNEHDLSHLWQARRLRQDLARRPNQAP